MQISQGVAQNVAQELLSHTELDIFDVSNVKGALKRIKTLILQYRPTVILSKHREVLEALIGPPPVHKDLLIARSAEGEYSARLHDADQLGSGALEPAEAPGRRHRRIEFNLEVDPHSKDIDSDGDVAADAAAGEPVHDQGAGPSGLGVRAGGTKKRKRGKKRKKNRKLERDQEEAMNEMRQVSGDQDGKVEQQQIRAIRTRNRKHANPNALDATTSDPLVDTEQLAVPGSRGKHSDAAAQSLDPCDTGHEDDKMIHSEANEVISIAETEDEAEARMDDASTAAATPVRTVAGNTPLTIASTVSDQFDTLAGQQEPADDCSLQEQTPKDTAVAPGVDCSPGTRTDDDDCVAAATSHMLDTPAVHRARRALPLDFPTVVEQHFQVNADAVKQRADAVLSPALQTLQSSGRRRSNRIRGMQSNIQQPSLATAQQPEETVESTAVQQTQSHTHTEASLRQTDDAEATTPAVNNTDSVPAVRDPDVVPAVNESDGVATPPDSPSAQTADEGADERNTDCMDGQPAREQQSTSQPMDGNLTAIPLKSDVALDQQPQLVVANTAAMPLEGNVACEYPSPPLEVNAPAIPLEGTVACEEPPQPLEGNAAGDAPPATQPDAEAVMHASTDPAIKLEAVTLEPKEEPSTVNTATLSRSLSALRAQSAGGAVGVHARANSMRHSFSSGVARSLASARRGLQSLPQAAILKAKELMGGRKGPQTSHSGAASSAERSEYQPPQAARHSAPSEPSHSEGSRGTARERSTRGPEETYATRPPQAYIKPETVFSGDLDQGGGPAKRETSRPRWHHSEPESSRAGRSAPRAALPQIETMVQGDNDNFADGGEHARAQTRRKFNPIYFPDTFKPPLPRKGGTASSNRVPVRTSAHADNTEGDQVARDATHAPHTSQQRVSGQPQPHIPVPNHHPPDLIQQSYSRPQDSARADKGALYPSLGAPQNAPPATQSAFRRAWNHLPPDLLDETERGSAQNKRPAVAKQAPNEKQKPAAERAGGFLRRRNSEDVDSQQNAAAAAASASVAASTDVSVSGGRSSISASAAVTRIGSGNIGAAVLTRTGSGNVGGEPTMPTERVGGFLVRRSETPPARSATPGATTAPAKPSSASLQSARVKGTEAAAQGPIQFSLSGSSEAPRASVSAQKHHASDFAPEADHKRAATKAARAAQDNTVVPTGGALGGRTRGPSTSPFAARILGEVGVSLRSSAPPNKSGSSPIDSTAAAKAADATQLPTDARSSQPSQAHQVPSGLNLKENAPAATSGAAAVDASASAVAAPQPPTSTAHDTHMPWSSSGPIPGIPGIPTRSNRQKRPLSSNPPESVSTIQPPPPVSGLASNVPPPPPPSQPHIGSNAYNPYNPYNPEQPDAQNTQSIPDKRRRVTAASERPSDISLQPQLPKAISVPAATPDAMHEAHAPPGAGGRGRFTDPGLPPDHAATALKQMHDMHAVMGQPRDNMPQIANDLQEGLRQRPSAQIPYTPAPVDGVRHDSGNPMAPEVLRKALVCCTVFFNRSLNMIDAELQFCSSFHDCCCRYIDCHLC